MFRMASGVKSRRERLISLIEQRGELDLTVLVRELAVSEATLRRDLTVLEQAGRLARTFGGAKSVPPPSLVARTFGEKREHMRPEKERLANRAADLVEPGMVVALDSGTTIWRVAAALRSKAPLTVVTSALAPVEELGNVPGITLHLVGGRFRPENLDFIGTSAAARYQGFQADIAFVGADSFVPGKGAYSLDEESAAVASALAACASRTVLVVDRSKIDAKGYFLVAAANDIDEVITDADLPRTLVSPA